MRNEQQVIKQLLDFANDDERIRAVALNGSRVNPNAPKDIMQDYDVVFYITDIEDERYKRNRDWIKEFGELVILQQNDSEEGYIFLMQFKDGVRIDLSFADMKETGKNEDSLIKVLLDKDDLFKDVPLPNDSIYLITKPTQEEFGKVLNECWWIQTYIAKGIWRDELPLVKYMFDVILIDCIRKLLEWHLGAKYDWKINAGKCGKWFKRLLTKDLYHEFIAIYPSTDYKDIWQSLFKAGKLIRRLGNELSDELGYTYPMSDDINVTEYIKKVKELPKDAIDF